MPAFLANPVAGGLIRFTDLFSPLLGLEHFVMMNDILAVRAENERRAHRQAEIDAKAKGGK